MPAPYYALKAKRYVDKYVNEAGTTVTVRRVHVGIPDVDTILSCLPQPLGLREVGLLQAQGVLNAADPIPTCLVFSADADVRFGDTVFVPEANGTETIYRVSRVVGTPGGGGCVIKKNVLVAREGVNNTPITPQEIADVPESISIVLTQGEKIPIYVSETARQGTIVFTSAPTFRLKDSTHTVVVGYDGIPVTAYDTTTPNTAQAYFNFDSALFAPGGYTGYMYLPLEASDGNQRIKEAVFDIYIREA